MILSVGDQERYKESLDVLREDLAARSEVRNAAIHERPQIIKALCRTALGISPEQDIAEIREPRRSRLLYVMRGVNEMLIDAAPEEAAGSGIMPPDVAEV